MWPKMRCAALDQMYANDSNIEQLGEFFVHAGTSGQLKLVPRKVGGSVEVKLTLLVQKTTQGLVRIIFCME